MDSILLVYTENIQGKFLNLNLMPFTQISRVGNDLSLQVCFQFFHIGAYEVELG